MAGLLEGKSGLITGGASGIGRATALAFAREGASVTVADIIDDAGKKVVGEIESAGGRARFVHLDVTSESDVENAVRSTVDAFGRLDCAVNNAGTTGAGGMIQQISLEDWRKTMSINLESVFLCLKYELPVMQEQKCGAIVNVASGAGLIAVPGLSPYCASKHGVLGLTKTAAVENARCGVRVNAICPGSTDTPMLRAAMDASPVMEKMIMSSLPSGRLGTPDEIAEAAVWLCSDRAAYVSGESMLVDAAAVAR
ncbi:MAG: glucose 1-dehydrogenase [Myxococcales bacterium]|nr:glucose 1-dehydrogenase [Myxococcales bacterium]TDJ18195.1 MAG: glucose 1-dehydrogenase [Deltaproteobacteria bacterium]